MLLFLILCCNHFEDLDCIIAFYAFMFYFREYKCGAQQTGGWVGFDNYNIYGTVKNSTSETSDLHLGMSIFCQMRFSRSRKSGEAREEVDRGWNRASSRIIGGVFLLSLWAAFTRAICTDVSVANMQEMFKSFLWCRSSAAFWWKWTTGHNFYSRGYQVHNPVLQVFGYQTYSLLFR